MPVTVKVEGFNDARAALRRLGDDIDDALDTAVKAGALLIENEAKTLAPKLSGTLARSITSQKET